MLSKWRDLTLLGEVEHCELTVQFEGEHRELNVQLEAGDARIAHCERQTPSRRARVQASGKMFTKGAGSDAWGKGNIANSMCSSRIAASCQNCIHLTREVPNHSSASCFFRITFYQVFSNTWYWYYVRERSTHS